MEFKLPIEYNTPNKLDDIVRKDLEIFSSDDDTQPPNLYKKLIGDSLLIDRWSTLYTTNKDFIKDTQKCIRKYNIHSIDTNEISANYNEFISETNFQDKFQYIGIPAAEPLNKSTTFLHCLGLYNLGAPVFSLVAPLFILIVPFVLIKLKGIPITINSYVLFLKELMQSTSIYSLFKSNIGLQQRISIMVSLFIYCLQVYHNIMSCISFYKNINVIYKFLTDYKEYLIKTDFMINEMNKHLSQYKTYESFIKRMKKEQTYIQEWIQKLERIFPTKHTFVKVGQIGILMQMYYELFNSDRCKLSFHYTIHLHQFNEDMNSFKKLVKKKKLGKCKFGTETNFKGMFYLAHIDQSYVTNDFSLQKNILLSGPNASGKTTILKSVILNVILSQHIGYGCYKKANISCYDSLHSYLNIPDTSGRDSLFQAEARRCNDIMKHIHETNDKRHLCIFDELMSGTNPVDAISCAEIYLKEMNDHKSKVDYIITTHYIQLCESFESDLHVINKKMNVKTTDDDITYLYKIADGISRVHGGKFVLQQIKENKI
jgi:hypothetical protein